MLNQISHKKWFREAEAELSFERGHFALVRLHNKWIAWNFVTFRVWAGLRAPGNTTRSPRPSYLRPRNEVAPEGGGGARATGLGGAAAGSSLTQLFFTSDMPADCRLLRPKARTRGRWGVGKGKGEGEGGGGCCDPLLAASEPPPGALSSDLRLVGFGIGRAKVSNMHKQYFQSVLVFYVCMSIHIRTNRIRFKSKTKSTPFETHLNRD